ncbi:unnamed protein product [Pedinophyceae sp. YPF-701]|nr:unnamed protein product [Pedinophyceae sp. YPF-701]
MSSGGPISVTAHAGLRSARPTDRTKLFASIAESGDEGQDAAKHGTPYLPSLKADDLFFQVVASPWWHSFVVIVCLITFLLDILVFVSSGYAAPEVSLVAPLLSVSCLVILVDAVGHILAGTKLGEFKLPQTYIVDGIVIAALITAGPLLTYSAGLGTFAAPAAAWEVVDHLAFVVRARVIAMTFLLPTAFMKIPVSIWRRNVWATSSLRRAKARASTSLRLKLGLMITLCLGMAGILLGEFMVLMANRRVWSQGEEIYSFIELLDLMPNREAFDVAVEQGIVNGVSPTFGLPLRQVWLDGAPILPINDSSSPGPDAMWLQAPSGRLVVLISFADEVDSAAAMHAVTKATILFLFALFSLLCYVSTEASLTRPLQRLLEELILSSRMIDSNGKLVQAEGTTRECVQTAAIEDCIEKIAKFMRRMARTYQGGRAVLERLMDSVPDEGAPGCDGRAGQEKETGLEFWAKMYEPVNIIPEAGGRAGAKSNRSSSYPGGATSSSQSGSASYGIPANINATGGTSEGSGSHAKSSNAPPAEQPPAQRGSMTRGGFGEMADAINDWKWTSLHCTGPDELRACVIFMLEDLDLITPEPPTQAQISRGSTSDKAAAAAMVLAGAAAAGESMSGGHHAGAPVRPKATRFALRRAVVRCVTLLEQEYASQQGNPYHTWMHAVDVFHCTYMILKTGKAAKDLPKGLGRSERLALMMAALAHDVGHRGCTNQFLVATSDDLALTYNDASVQENLHISVLFKLMAKNHDADFLSCFGYETRVRCRALMLRAVLGTDMAQHFSMTASLRALADGYSAGDLEITPAEEACQISTALLHMADLCGVLKDDMAAVTWATLVLEEFFEQGKMEHQLSLPSLPLMQASKTYIAGSQIEFIEFVAAPFLIACVKVMPSLHSMWEPMTNTLRMWLGVVARDQMLKPWSSNPDEPDASSGGDPMNGAPEVDEDVAASVRAAELRLGSSPIPEKFVVMNTNAKLKAFKERAAVSAKGGREAGSGRG